VDLYRKVRLACAEGMSQREAARHFNVSRDSVAKMMVFSVPPGYRRTAPVKRPKLDAFTGVIDAWLEGDREVHRKQRHTAKRVELCLNLGDAHRQAARFSVSLVSSIPSLNLIPSMTFGN
jgi:hypothetical protein